MMRKMMVAASLWAMAACGSTIDEGENGECTENCGPDTTPPVIALASSPVHDERGDAIDFSSGEPVHAHDGEAIDLAGADCPDVYKYGYLMSSTGPTFGRQASQNPLAWNVTIDDATLDPDVTAYRVRDAAGGILLDWTALAKTDDGYRVSLYRDGEHGIAALGTTDAEYKLDVRARDKGGLETVSTYCWKHHPLAAPLGFEPLAQANRPFQLFGMSFAAGSAMSPLMTPGSLNAVAAQPFVQYTAEPVILQLVKPTSSPRYRKTYVDDYVQIGTGPGGVCDDFSPMPANCDMSPLPDPADVTTTGTIGSHGEGFAIIDDATGLPLQLGESVTIPPRAANEPPHRYRIEWQIGGATDLLPAGNAVSEYQIGGVGYTGRPVTEYLERCAHVTTRCPGGNCVDTCDGTIQYGRMVALDELQLEFDPIVWTVRTSASSTITPVAVTYAPESMFTSASLAWDAGNDDLPGPK
ncbi:MAG: hypothetical protein HOV81_19710 [Kofleriaceae bacterium]|nr:hypothetical protein [Kofleriaceae bacterium]